MNNYTDKVVWITGASSGLGEASATELGKQGAKLILSGRNTDALQKVQSKIEQSKVVAFDMADSTVFQTKVNEAIEAFGHIDTIIHNAGVAQNAFAEDIDSQTEEQILQIDYLSPVALTKYLLPHMSLRGQGQIVVISGLLAYINLPGRSTYAASKAALSAYFGCLRAELKSKNIGVSVVIPGTLATNLVNKALTSDGSSIDGKKAISGYPLEMAAKKIVSALACRKHQIYIGSRKEFTMWKLWGLYPNFIINKILQKMA